MAGEDECKFSKESCKWSIPVLFNILHQKAFIKWNVIWTPDTPTWLYSGWGLGGVDEGDRICLFLFAPTHHQSSVLVIMAWKPLNPFYPTSWNRWRDCVLRGEFLKARASEQSEARNQLSSILSQGFLHHGEKQFFCLFVYVWLCVF